LEADIVVGVADQPNQRGQAAVVPGITQSVGDRHEQTRVLFTLGELCENRRHRGSPVFLVRVAQRSEEIAADCSLGCVA
jgi:hypothetical protein